MAGNEQVLEILSVLTQSSPAAAVQHAIDQVSDAAVDDAAHAGELGGNAFDASADSLSTLSFSSFSPATVLAQTASLAASDPDFGTARDRLWQVAAHESVFDGTQTLLGENPAFQTPAIQAFTSQLASDGSLTTTVGSLEQLVETGVTQIGDQNCTLPAGSNGSTPSDCTAGALYNAQMVAQACPGGITSGGDCGTARSQAESDEAAELAQIAANQAAATAAAQALGTASQNLQAAEAGEAQAAAEVADEENQYLAWQTTQSIEKAGFDVGTLAVSLSVSEIDPVTVVTGLFNVIGDAVGFGFSGPDPNTIILQGIQDLSQQLSDFETYTQSAFSAIDTALSGISSQIAQESYQLSAQLTQVQAQITALAGSLTSLQGSVDHLESEVQSLFAQGANNELNTIINQDLGYQQANGTPLPEAQFAQAAGALYQDATSTSLTSTVLTIPGAFDAVDADSLVTASDPLSLDSNINYFNLFGGGVSAPPGDSWPGDLTTACAPGANPTAGLCLPNPDYWATAARASAQLLEENPQYVTPTRLTQLSTIEQDGDAITGALQQLSVNNAGPDPGGTGNATLDAAIKYYQYWGAGTASTGPPTLVQAISAEEQR
jgi:hypothetical protein